MIYTQALGHGQSATTPDEARFRVAQADSRPLCKLIYIYISAQEVHLDLWIVFIFISIIIIVIIIIIGSCSSSSSSKWNYLMIQELQ